MKTHTTKGANILRPVTQLAEMLPGIELHHEALDGRGYPYGLTGEQIPLLARVIAVADTFDALTTNRPYQHAHTPEEALKIIQSLVGKRLDPVPVAALMAVYGRGEIRIQRSFAIKRPIAVEPKADATATATLPIPPGEAVNLERTRV
jgi:HD-GYP domain-containing protein (c-di-GMP phosphodiesterase class II)